jgi:hypothetical protein
MAVANRVSFRFVFAMESEKLSGLAFWCFAPHDRTASRPENTFPRTTKSWSLPISRRPGCRIGRLCGITFAISRLCLDSRPLAPFRDKRLRGKFLLFRSSSVMFMTVQADLAHYGIGFHHAGLTTEDRNLVESEFAKRRLPIICSSRLYQSFPKLI